MTYDNFKFLGVFMYFRCKDFAHFLTRAIYVFQM